jgi:hypothetical protein
MKNPHAVALGRLGGAKGGPARAKVLSAKRRREIAQKAGLARVKGLSRQGRGALALRAASARWAMAAPIRTAAEAPVAVRRLMKSYDPSALKWSESDHRYAIVRAILVRGDDEAARWLGKMLRRAEICELVQRYGGAGCNQPERQKLRKKLRLTLADIPNRPYLGFKWPDQA